MPVTPSSKSPPAAPPAIDRPSASTVDSAGLASASEQRLFAIVFVALAAISLWPIWLVRFHPIADLPNNVAAVAVLHYLNDPRFDFARYYELHLSPVPYWIYYGLLH